MKFNTLLKRWRDASGNILKRWRDASGNILKSVTDTSRRIVSLYPEFTDWGFRYTKPSIASSDIDYENSAYR